MRLTPETRRRFEAGLFGRKSGAGFYRYTDGKVERAEEAPPPERRPARVWVSQADALGGERVAACLNAVSDAVEMETGGAPSADALCLVTPAGRRRHNGGHRPGPRSPADIGRGHPP